MNSPSRRWLARTGQRLAAAAPPRSGEAAPPDGSDRPSSGGDLRGYLEEPADGAVLGARTARVTGWALCGNRAARLVAVSINGRVHGSTSPSLPRPDVGQVVLGGGVPECGWCVELDIGDEPSGPAQVTVVVCDGERSYPLPPVTVELSGDRPTPGPPGLVAYLDAPGPDALRGLVYVGGWASARGDPVSSVELVVDGDRQGLARIAGARADVDRHYPGRGALLSGFEGFVDLRRLRADRASLEVRVATLTGQQATIGPLPLSIVAVEPTPAGSQRIGLLRKENDAAFQQWSKPRPAGLHLLAVTHSLQLGGGQLYLHEMLDKMGAGRDFPCTVLAFQGGPLLDALDPLGIRARVVTGVPVDDADAYEMLSGLLGRWIAERGFTAVLVNTMGAFLGTDLAVRLGLPVVWAIHESYDLPEYWHAAYGDALHPDVRGRAEQALRDCTVTVFEALTTQELYAPYVTPSQSRLIPYGIDLATVDAYRRAYRRADVRERLGLPPEATVILCMGSTEPRKSQTMLAEAFAVLKEDFPDAILVMVGLIDTPYGRALGQWVEENGLSERIRLVAPTADVYGWYLTCDLLVSASDVESIPRSVFEAMAFEVPVLAGSVYGLPELITEGETGYLFPTRDLGLLVHHLNRALSLPPDERRRVGGRGGDLVRRCHSSEGYAQAFRELLLSLAAARR